MKISYFLIAVILGSSYVHQANAVYSEDNSGHIAVANRGAGTVSIIDVQTDIVVNTLALPAAALTPEPMYVVYKDNRIYVGDRANNRVLVYDSFGFNLLKAIPTGEGVFHMWPAKEAQLLLVNNDIDKTVTVIDTNSLSVIKTLSLPMDLLSQGYKPHDVFVTNKGKNAFVSLVDGEEGNDYIIKLSIKRNIELSRKEVGGDPHLFISPIKRNTLYVPSQESGEVLALNTRNLVTRYQFDVPNAHGVYALGRRLYVTNIAEGGSHGLYTLDAKGRHIIDTDNTPYGAPHNISVTSNGRKIYVTHSGATQDKVSVYQTIPGRELPSYLGEVTVQSNPFGLAYIPH
ncbi:YncE family protein [Shewanella sp. D64]|uniref:YncE family protein n=1 Tax=unclassified Shewanella TaxID=196818 RepID=UPI0022BA58D6|nr:MULTISPECIES: YncE family protein [unclassified Shewanella]MEC4724905.1 YncE family protein [Shewanella sp. D64]MEC4736302.1 YncE family protein [Shewanella sp. E94]WBJ97635.1 YncE family protein [Shewanella sp. MTB7]